MPMILDPLLGATRSGVATRLRGDHNKGWFLDAFALRAAYPTASLGDFATVGGNTGGPSIWVWDEYILDWEDSASSGLVISVFGRVGVISAQAGDYAAFYDTVGAAAAGDAAHLGAFVHGDIALNTSVRHAQSHALDSVSDHSGTLITSQLPTNGIWTIDGILTIASATDTYLSFNYNDVRMDISGAMYFKLDVDGADENYTTIIYNQFAQAKLDTGVITESVIRPNYLLLHNVTAGVPSLEWDGDDLLVDGDIVISGANNRLKLPQKDNATTPTLAFGDGDSGFYENVDDSIFLSLGGNIYVKFTQSWFQFGADGGKAGVMIEVPSATNPTFVPERDDNDTGIGHAGANLLSLIAGGVEGIRISTTASTINKPVLAIGSDADGDIYYRASGVLARLAKGTALQHLRMNAGATAPEWGFAIPDIGGAADGATIVAGMGVAAWAYPDPSFAIAAATPGIPLDADLFGFVPDLGGGLASVSWTNLKTAMIGGYGSLGISAGQFIPTTTNPAETGTLESSVNKVNLDYFAFDAGATEEHVNANVIMPDDWNGGTFKVKFHWSSATGSTAGDTVEWGVRALGLIDNEIIDSAFGTPQTISDALLADNGAKMQTSAATVAITAAGPGTHRTFILDIYRNTDGTDDMAEDAWLFAIEIQYTKKTTQEVAW